MKQTITLTCVALALGALSGPLAADNLTDSSRYLCSPAQTTICTADSECYAVAPWDLNIPMFIRVDLEAKTLSTTEASDEPRTTPIGHLQQDDGVVYMQGVERDRAYSIVIVEESGMLSATILDDGVSASIFGACTPASGGAP